MNAVKGADKRVANHGLRSNVRFVVDVLSAACLIVLMALLVPRVLLPLIGDEATDVAIVTLGGVTVFACVTRVW